ncbi:MAG: RcpC/CpaB family pilus assembly protein [Jatrophihabitantaceae bacterium]
MPRLSRGRLAVLGRWPRRIAAAACLLLAAASALSAQRAPVGTAAPVVPGTPVERLAPGQVAMPVRLAGGASFVKPGDRVDLLAAAGDPGLDAAPATLRIAAEGLLVLAVTEAKPDTGSADGVEVLVATERTVAARIAALGTRQIFAALDKSP